MKLFYCLIKTGNRKFEAFIDQQLGVLLAEYNNCTELDKLTKLQIDQALTRATKRFDNFTMEIWPV